jgi:hypothetical protein
VQTYFPLYGLDPGKVRQPLLLVTMHHSCNCPSDNHSRHLTASTVYGTLNALLHSLLG